jgi:hypothetical protein
MSAALRGSFSSAPDEQRRFGMLLGVIMNCAARRRLTGEARCSMAHTFLAHTVRRHVQQPLG